MPQIILILGIIGLNLTVMLVSLKMNWLDILPMSIHLVGFTLLAAILSKKLIRSRGHLPFLNFRAIVITIGLLFGSMTTNVLFQLGQKQVIGHVQTADSSKAAYEGQHGRAVELFGRKLTDEQATLSLKLSG